MKKTDALGILRYAPGTGAAPEWDKAHFDGWYFGKWGHDIAHETYDRWVKQYPGWTIALVVGAPIYFGENQTNAPAEPQKSLKLLINPEQ